RVRHLDGAGVLVARLLRLGPGLLALGEVGRARQPVHGVAPRRAGLVRAQAGGRAVLYLLRRGRDGAVADEDVPDRRAVADGDRGRPVAHDDLAVEAHRGRLVHGDERAAVLVVVVARGQPADGSAVVAGLLEYGRGQVGVAQVVELGAGGVVEHGAVLA